MIMSEGVDRLLIDVCEERGLSYSVVRGRIVVMGWSVEDALTRPVRPRKRRM
jgi:hypothetical protein